MRVLNVISRPAPRGAELFALDLSKWLRQEGHAARVVALYGHAGTRMTLAADDVELGINEYDVRERIFNPRLILALAREIRSFRPDVVQCNGGRTVKYAALVRVLCPSALWVYRNIDSPSFWLKTRQARLLLPVLVRAGFDAVVGVSDATLKEVHSLYGFHERSAVIENGVDFSRLGRVDPLPAAVSGGRISLVWVGEFGSQKRPDAAIEVMMRLPDRVSLTMVGDGPWLDMARNMVEVFGLQSRVRVLGRRTDVGEILRVADLLLITSDTEGIPAVALEAQYVGIPVVGFDVGGLREAVPHGGPGRLVRHGDRDALAEAVLLEAERGTGADVHGRLRVWAERFCIKRIGRRYVEFYSRMADFFGAR